jgi:hypothetical protein
VQAKALLGIGSLALSIIDPFGARPLRGWFGLGIVYHDGVETIGPEHYLDHVHVDAAEYQAILEAIWPLARGQIADRNLPLTGARPQRLGAQTNSY